MQKDFHYYATYCAAYLAGYSHAESMAVCYSAQLVDWCTRTLLKRLGAPASAATTQLQLELMDARTDLVGLQDITRIWASFHFLPRNLYAKKQGCSRRYRYKYRLICGPNGALVRDTVELARSAGTLQAAGLAMHVLADTWAHQYFAGTPSLVINNTNYHFFELLPDGDGWRERPVTFIHSPSKPDDPETGCYTASVYRSSENSIMNLGHGRAGHLPDYSFIRYKYLPAWGEYNEIVKDNPSDYYHAFFQMVHALKYLRGACEAFETDTYDEESAALCGKVVQAIICKPQLDACEDWKALGEVLSGETVDDFDLYQYQGEYMGAQAAKKDDTFMGRFLLAALAQKSMVTNKIYKSGNPLAGYSVDFDEKGFRGIRDYFKLVERAEKEQSHG